LPLHLLDFCVRNREIESNDTRIADPLRAPDEPDCSRALNFEFPKGHAVRPAATIPRPLQTGYNNRKEPLAIQIYGKSKDKNQKAEAPDHGLEYWPAASISAEKDSYRRQSLSARSRSGSHAGAFQIQTTEAEEKVANQLTPKKTLICPAKTRRLADCGSLHWVTPCA
jgi:hypothetical protein